MHVVYGVKNATAVLGSEVRENAAAVTEHREGAEAAQLTREKVFTCAFIITRAHDTCIHTHRIYTNMLSLIIKRVPLTREPVRYFIQFSLSIAMASVTYAYQSINEHTHFSFINKRLSLFLN